MRFCCAALLLPATLLGSHAAAQTPPANADPAPISPAAGTKATAPAPAAKAAAAKGPAPVRVRLVVNGVYPASSPKYSDTRQIPEYQETTTIHSSYEAKSAFGPDAAVQVTAFRGLGVLVGWSSVDRDVTGTIDVSRPHPLYLNQPRTASATLDGYKAKETALHFDLAWAATRGHLDWSVFAGVTQFQVDADLLDVPTYNDAYPYDELTITSTSSKAVKESKTSFDVGGRLDYRFGASGRFGAGVQLRYSAATVELKASTATSPASYDAGGLQVAAGLRLYF